MKELTRYFAYLKGRYLTLAAALLCAIIFGASSGLGIPLIIQYVFRFFFNPPEGVVIKTWHIVAVAALLPAVFLMRAVFGFLNGYLMSVCALDVLRKIKGDIFAKVQDYPLAFFDRHTTGDLYVRLSNDTGTIQAILIRCAAELIQYPLQIIGAMGALAYMCMKNSDVAFLLVFFLLAPVMVLPVQLMRRRLKKYARQTQEKLGTLSQLFAENLDATHEVRMFNLQKRENERFDGTNRLFQRIVLKLTKYELTQQPMMEVVASVMISVVFLYAFYNKIPFDTFAALAAALYFTADPIKRGMRLVSDLYKTMPLVHRVNEILDYNSPVPEPENPAAVARLHGQVTFDNVSFAYGEKVVLKNASIQIPAGTSCALVGESGAGKSTFVKLLMRFYDPTQGAVRIDGIALKDMSTHDLRKNLGSVPQYPVLFNDTVFNNIALAKEGATAEEVYTAAKRAYAHDFILELENGYETMVGERGDRLSGGQKQRIALARVFLKDAPILILDEATSALDSNSERAIQLALDALMGERTAFIIAHRFSTIRNVKQIIIFKDGEILDFGSHDELMERCAHYGELYRRQILGSAGLGGL